MVRTRPFFERIARAAVAIGKSGGDAGASDAEESYRSLGLALDGFDASSAPTKSNRSHPLVGTERALLYTTNVERGAKQGNNTGFELFEPGVHDDLPKGRPGAWLPQVRLEKSAVWTINRTALESLDNPEAVTLWYGSQRGRVGFGAAKKGEPAAYAVRSPGPRSRSNQGLVTGKKFCSHHGMPHEK